MSYEEHTLEQGHYTGLVADWYDDFLAGEGEDILLYSSLIQEEPGPALELACGTGRIMLSLLRSGMEVDGIDISGDMLARCRMKIEAEGFGAQLFEQGMAECDTGRQYRTIFVSGGSFQLLPTLGEARNALAAARRNLIPGGRFILDLVVGPAPFGGNDPNIWKTGRIASRGNERVVYSSRTQSDPFTQQSHLLTRYAIYRDGVLVDTLLGELLLREYSRGEAELLLAESGFSVERIEQRRVMSTHSVSVLFVCRKPD
ncbi:MAG: class I SAM-dependent methyltransferase [Bacteroidetes bacterium]|nr:class I SAM-dependent methyltransferase [Bacteroidota bacterium]